MKLNRNTLGNARADELKWNRNNLFYVSKDLSTWKIHIPKLH